MQELIEAVKENTETLKSILSAQQQMLDLLQTIHLSNMHASEPKRASSIPGVHGTVRPGVRAGSSMMPGNYEMPDTAQIIKEARQKILDKFNDKQE